MAAPHMFKWKPFTRVGTPKVTPEESEYTLVTVDIAPKLDGEWLSAFYDLTKSLHRRIENGEDNSKSTKVYMRVLDADLESAIGTIDASLESVTKDYEQAVPRLQAEQIKADERLASLKARAEALAKPTKRTATVL
ncbi:hypothetical protein [Nocardia niigatensis]